MMLGPDTKVVQSWEDSERHRSYRLLRVVELSANGYCGEIIDTSGEAHNPCIALSDQYKQPAPALRWLKSAQQRDSG